MSNSNQDMHTKEMSEFYDRVSGTYDQVRHTIFCDFGRLAIEQLSIRPGSSVLDLATGRGAMLFPAAIKTGEAGLVIGVDISEKMVEYLNADLALESITHAHAQVMTVEKLHFPDDHFDYLTCGFSIFFFSDLMAALNEAKRVLKPNGKILIATWHSDPDSAFAGNGWYWKLVRQFKPQDVVSPNPIDFGSPDGMSQLLHSTGFRNPRFAVEDRTYVYSDEEEWWSEQHTHGGKRAIELIPQSELAEFKSKVFAKLQDFKNESGVSQKISVLFSIAQK